MFYQTDSWHDVECLLFAVISVHSGKCLAICHPVVEAALASVLSQLVSKLLAITLPDQSSTSLEIHFFSILLLIAPRKKNRGQSQISRVPKGRESWLEICISICGCLNCNQIENQSSKVIKLCYFRILAHDAPNLRVPYWSDKSRHLWAHSSSSCVHPGENYPL